MATKKEQIKFELTVDSSQGNQQVSTIRLIMPGADTDKGQRTAKFIVNIISPDKDFFMKFKPGETKTITIE